MQPYMDRVLTDAERAEAETHLDECTYCRKRYRFEEKLRAVRAAGSADGADARRAKTKLARTCDTPASRGARLDVAAAAGSTPVEPARDHHGARSAPDFATLFARAARRPDDHVELTGPVPPGSGFVATPSCFARRTRDAFALRREVHRGLRIREARPRGRPS